MASIPPGFRTAHIDHINWCREQGISTRGMETAFQDHLNWIRSLPSPQNWEEPGRAREGGPRR